MRRRNVVAALAVTATSAAAAYVVRRRGRHGKPHVGLYFEDGSMVALPQGAPQVEALLDLGDQALAAIGSE